MKRCCTIFVLSCVLILMIICLGGCDVNSTLHSPISTGNTSSADNIPSLSQSTNCTESSAAKQTEPASDHQIAGDDIPPIYDATIEDYKKIVAFVLSADFAEKCESGYKLSLNPDLTEDLNQNYNTTNGQRDLASNWHIMMHDMRHFVSEKRSSSFVYQITDINSDNIPELMWTNKDRTFIFAIFTVYNGKVKLLDTFRSRYRGEILDSGEILTTSSSGVDIVQYGIYEIDCNTEQVYVPVCIFGYDREMYYKVVNNERKEITAEQFIELRAEYSKR